MTTKQMAYSLLISTAALVAPANAQSIPASIPTSGLDMYSLNETMTNKVWVDDRLIYRKVLHLTALPNNTTINYPLGITYSLITSIGGIGYGVYGGAWPVNVGCFSSANSMINIAVNGSNLTVATGRDFSSASAYVIIEYVK